MNFKFLYILLLFTSIGLAKQDKPEVMLARISESEELKPPQHLGDTLRADELNRKASKFLYRNLDSVGVYSLQAISLADRSGYEEGQIRGRYFRALYLSETGKPDDAFKLLKESERIARGCSNNDLLLTTYGTLGDFHATQGNIKESNEYFNKAIAIGEQRRSDLLGRVSKPNEKNTYHLSLVYEGLATNYFKLNYYNEALNYINIADALNQEVGNDLYTGQTLANKAEILMKMHRFEDALVHINESIDLFIAKETKDWLAFAERVKGDIFYEQNYYRLALESYNKAHSLQKELDDPREKAFLENAMAKVYFANGNHTQARKFAKEALAKGKNLEELTIITESSYILFRTYEDMGDLSSALYFHKLHKRYNDSLFNEENIKSLAIQEIQMQRQKDEAEYQFLAQKAASKQRLLIFLSSGGILILLSVLFLTQRNRKLERKLNDLLSKKNKILGRREIQLKWLNETKVKLFSIISHDLRAPIASLNNLIDLLNDEQIAPEEFIDYAPELSDQVKNVSFTLNNLLLWSQQQMKGARNMPKRHNLRRLADLSVDLLIHQARKKNIIIRNELPAEAAIYGDGDQITIIFRNLISNAIKFTESEGAIILRAKEIEGAWEVEVKDTGIGMDTITIERILAQNSYMESTYGTHNEKGTGIGLNLCREMISKSGGEFYIESAIGLGSSFFFTLEKYESEVQEIKEPLKVF